MASLVYVVVFGNNTASDISKFDLENFQNITRRYYCQTPTHGVMLLFVYNRRHEIFGNAQETYISLRLK